MRLNWAGNSMEMTAAIFVWKGILSVGCIQMPVQSKLRVRERPAHAVDNMSYPVVCLLGLPTGLVLPSLLLQQTRETAMKFYRLPYNPFLHHIFDNQFPQLRRAGR
ncbi:hypothetical protein BO94DRAFT_388435 [Aspergillus sclerotioniger CBS 115572]|uniref:Uncharacterized protein n=1 Tax=Aspergillus sclerotioniger CBS 115572 TaxID=1450535 RepID=A0A317X2X2_9EURO|nr:hypothetical protein BO94DRAFT_388435 [Aspergillus sclerotioniger CBS 115572]PWY91338.1 hypothetical protein BO94DRAFT_388435 [Aspergillus sclerotioniger CBS 115572]